MKHLATWWAAHVAGLSLLVLWLKPSVDAFLAQHPHPTEAAIFALIVGACVSPGVVKPAVVTRVVSATPPPEPPPAVKP